MATEPTERRKSTRLRRANVILDAEGVLHERLHSLRCSRQGHASVVSARVNEIIGLLSDDRNHQDVKEKLVYLSDAYAKFKDAYRDYSSLVHDEGGIAECHEFLLREEEKSNSFHRKIDDCIANTESKLLAASLQVDSKIRPEVSVRRIGGRTPPSRELSKGTNRTCSSLGSQRAYLLLWQEQRKPQE